MRGGEGRAGITSWEHCQKGRFRKRSEKFVPGILKVGDVSYTPFTGLRKYLYRLDWCSLSLPRVAFLVGEIADFTDNKEI